MDVNKRDYFYIRATLRRDYHGLLLLHFYSIFIYGWLMNLLSFNCMVFMRNNIDVL